MARTSSAATVALKCPRCGGPVRKDGSMNGNGGRQHGTQRYKCKRIVDGKHCWRGLAVVGREQAESAGVDKAAVDALRRSIVKTKGVRRYAITAAQNATPVFGKFFDTLEAYCRATDRQLIVIPYRYKNPTAFWSKAAEHDDWWDARTVPYLLDQRAELCANLVVLGDIKTQPTASDPLQGFETIVGARSGVIGHPKLELVTVPTPQSALPKIMTTTGACTKANYIPAKAGKKAEFHHTFAACAVDVEEDGGIFHIRQLVATSSGSFCDLDTEYDGAERRPVRIDALVMGDTHQEFVDPAVIEATFGEGGLVPTLRPRTLVWHDVHDFYSRNHHHRGRVFINYVKHHSGKDNVEEALRGTFEFVDGVTPPDVRNVFVASNHPEALVRWVEETDPRTDPENAVFWAETFTAMCRAAKWTDTGASTIDPFAHWGKLWLQCASRSTFLARDESFTVRGIELSFHGDKGSNGARGSRRTFDKIGVRTVIGHSHSPGISGGCYQVGLNARYKLDYAQGGPSSWLQTDCVIYPNGKRSLVNIIGGRFRA